jgi:C_GCAxxG_C_C family probable redox protein
MEEIEEKAILTFRAGLNCSQAVAAAFAEKLGYDREMVLDLATGFGGGMGHMQETCGAVTGAFMVLGMYNRRIRPDNLTRKQNTYPMVQKFNARFLEIHSTTRCIDLIRCDLNTPEGKALAKENRVHETICEDCISTSVRILNDLMR